MILPIWDTLKEMAVSDMAGFSSHLPIEQSIATLQSMGLR